MTSVLETARTNLGYALSLPDRFLRAVAAGAGGLIYEATEVLLPGWLRMTSCSRRGMGFRQMNHYRSSSSLPRICAP